MTRDVTFKADTWQGLFQNYADPGCTQPLSSFSIVGPYKITGPSTKVPGGFEGELSGVNVKVTPQAPPFVDFLNSAPAGSCGTNKWQLNVEQDIAATKGCPLLGAKLPVTEFELIKLEKGQLYFGARPTEANGDIQSAAKRPTSYQPPLVKADASTPTPYWVKAGTLLPAPLKTSDLTGANWISTECETQSGPQFVTRDYSFKADSWIGNFKTFADPNCTQPALFYEVEGPYKLTGPSATVTGGTEDELSVTKAVLNPQSQPLVDLLNSGAANSCGNAKWQLNVEQDISATKGCAALGIQLPTLEYELIKIENGEFFQGTRPTDGSRPITTDKRATSYQAGLVKSSGNQSGPGVPDTGFGSSNMDSGSSLAIWLVAILGLAILVAGKLLLKRLSRRV